MNKEKFEQVKNTFPFLVDLLKWDFSTLVLFEIVYKCIFLFLVPYVYEYFSKALNNAGIHYISKHTVKLLLYSPVSILLLILLLLFAVFTVMIELSAIIIYCDYSIRKEKLTFFFLFFHALKRSFRIFYPKNLMMLLPLLFLLPLSGVTLLNSPFEPVKLPEFLIKSMTRMPALSLVYILVFFIIVICIVFFLFTLPEIILHGTGFFPSCKKAYFLLKNKKMQTMVTLLLWSAVSILLILAIGMILIFTCLFYVKNNYPSDLAKEMFFKLIFQAGHISIICLSIYIMTAGQGLFSLLFYDYQGIYFSIGHPEEKSRKDFIFMILRVALIFGTAALYSRMLMPSFRTQLMRSETQVIAHRGGGQIAPENTLAALKEAAKSGALYAEIDVQQTKDGALIVMHDTNFKRTAGVNKNVWDVTLEEVKTYDAGSFYDSRYAGEKIPTLEEMIELAGGSIGLLIEIKKDSHAKDTPEKTIALLRSLEFADQCIIASLDYGIIKRVKKLAPEIQTAYLAATAYGDFKKKKAADTLGIEKKLVTAKTISVSHRLNKPLFVWTVNNKDTMQKMINMGVDAIITDNPYLAQIVIDSEPADILIQKLADFFLDK